MMQNPRWECRKERLDAIHLPRILQLLQTAASDAALCLTKYKCQPNFRLNVRTGQRTDVWKKRKQDGESRPVSLFLRAIYDYSAFRAVARQISRLCANDGPDGNLYHPARSCEFGASRRSERHFVFVCGKRLFVFVFRGTQEGGVAGEQGNGRESMRGG